MRNGGMEGAPKDLFFISLPSKFVFGAAAVNLRNQ